MPAASVSVSSVMMCLLFAEKGFIWVLWTHKLPIYESQLNFTRFGNCILSFCRLSFTRRRRRRWHRLLLLLRWHFFSCVYSAAKDTKLVNWTDIGEVNGMCSVYLLFSTTQFVANSIAQRKLNILQWPQRMLLLYIVTLSEVCQNGEYFNFDSSIWSLKLLF